MLANMAPFVHLFGHRFADFDLGLKIQQGHRNNSNHPHQSVCVLDQAVERVY